MEELIGGELVVPKDPQKSFHPIRNFSPPNLLKVSDGGPIIGGTLISDVFVSRSTRKFTILCEVPHSFVLLIILHDHEMVEDGIQNVAREGH